MSERIIKIMLKLIEAMGWLCSTYIILLSTQYILALYYQRGPSNYPAASLRPTPFTRKSRSPFLFRDLNSAEEHNSSKVLFYVSDSPTFDLAKNTFSQIRKHYINPLAVYSLEPRSRLFHPTVGNLELLSQEIERAVSRLPHLRRGKQTKLIFIVSEEVSESLLRYLATCSHSQLQLIDSVLFINPSGSFSTTKQLHIEDMMFKKKNRELLQERAGSIKQIKVIVVTTQKSKEDGAEAYPYTVGKLWKDIAHIKTIEMWNIYRVFQYANKLLTYKPFLQVLSGFLVAEYARTINLTETEYYFKYGEPLLKTKEEDGVTDQQMNFKSLCPSSLQISFSDKQESLMTSSRCFSISINEQQSLSLLIRSGAHLHVFTDSQQQIIPYFFNQTFYMYFIENTNSCKTYHVSNPKQMQTTISYTQVIQLSESNITGRKGNSDLQFAKVIKLPKIPLKVCTSQDLDLPSVSKDSCFDSQGSTIFRWKDVQLNFHMNNQELYGRLFRKYEYMHANLVFANVLALVFLNYKYAWLMFINIGHLMIGCGDSSKGLFISLYVFFVLSLCQLSITLLQKLIQIRARIRLKPTIQAFLLVAPSIVGVCRFINFELFLGTEWISLLLSYFVVVGVKGQFVGLYLIYLSWDYIVQGQPTYHFIVMLFWTYSLYFQGDVHMYESDRIYALTQVTFFLMLFESLEVQAIFHLLSEVYVLQLIGILVYFTVKKQTVLRKIHYQLRLKELPKQKL